jgi:hypothetical protein
MADDDGARDVSELVNCLTWTAAMVDKALPLRPHDTEREYRDRMALRREAFAIILKEQLAYEYKASPDYLMGLTGESAAREGSG